MDQAAIAREMEKRIEGYLNYQIRLDPQRPWVAQIDEILVRCFSVSESTFEGRTNTFRPTRLIQMLEISLRVFANKSRLDVLIGDLYERCNDIQDRSGIPHAHRWYKRQLICSIRSLLWSELKRLSGLQTILKRIGR